VPIGPGPVVRTDATNWIGRIGDTLAITVLLDTRNATVGSAALAVDVSFLVGGTFAAPNTTPTPIVTQTSSGVIRIALGAATGMTGSVAVLNLKLVNRTATSGYIYLYGLDLSAVDGSSLTSVTSSTRIPIVIR
jgi:hypothetical protein